MKKLCTDERPCVACFTDNGICDDTISKFKELTSPLIKFINDVGHPHMHIVISTDHAELSEGLIAHSTDEFIVD